MLNRSSGGPGEDRDFQSPVEMQVRQIQTELQNHFLGLIARLRLYIQQLKFNLAADRHRFRLACDVARTKNRADLDIALKQIDEYETLANSEIRGDFLEGCNKLINHVERRRVDLLDEFRRELTRLRVQIKSAENLEPKSKNYLLEHVDRVFVSMKEKMDSTADDLVDRINV
jgi:hypothetical protein